MPVARRTRPLLRLVGTLLAAVALAGCAGGSSRPHLVVIVIDTLRADRLGAYGSVRPLTPFLDALAARGTVFRQAYAPSSWTNPSVASLFTARLQSQHHVTSFGARLAEEETTLAEVLRDAGYATAGFVANGVVNEAAGFGQGFDVYEAWWLKPQPGRKWGLKHRTDDVRAELVRWLDEDAPAGRPRFLYLHYVEPHTPFSPPDAALAPTLRGPQRPDLVERVNSAMVFANAYPPEAEMLRAMEDVYDAEVLDLDRGLRETFEALRTRGVLDDAVVVVTSDHGEEFRDHGGVGHGTTLYNELIRVPLIVVLPGQTTPRVVHEPVSLIDVAPTLVELAGAPRPRSFGGRSLVARLTGGGDGRAGDGAAVSELLTPDGEPRTMAHQRAVVVGTRKVIVHVDGTRERYDLAADGGERSGVESLGDEAPFEALLDVVAGQAARPSGPAPTVTPEIRERLRALGYLN